MENVTASSHGAHTTLNGQSHRVVTRHTTDVTGPAHAARFTDEDNGAKNQGTDALAMKAVYGHGGEYTEAGSCAWRPGPCMCVRLAVYAWHAG